MRKGQRHRLLVLEKHDDYESLYGVPDEDTVMSFCVFGDDGMDHKVNERFGLEDDG